MNSLIAAVPETAHRAPGRAAPRVRVWDPFVRIFHWGLAAAMAVALVTEGEPLELHAWAGYAALGLIVTRLVWGFVGPRHARWADCVRGPRATLAYLREVLAGHPRRYLGHNPAGAAMALALIAGVGLTALSGMALLGAEEFAGPLAGLMQGLTPYEAHALEEVHEFLAWGTLALVPLHLLGVALASLQHRENLVRSLIDGDKRGDL